MQRQLQALGALSYLLRNFACVVNSFLNMEIVHFSKDSKRVATEKENNTPGKDRTRGKELTLT